MAIVLSGSSISGWSSPGSEINEDDKAQVARIRKESYSIQLCSFEIPDEKKGRDIAAAELDRLTNLARQNNYNLSQHALFSAKVTGEKYAFCTPSGFNKDNVKISHDTLDKIFNTKPFIREPKNIDHIPLDFAIYRPATQR